MSPTIFLNGGTVPQARAGEVDPLAARYGRPSKGSRTTLVAVVAVIAVGLLAFLAWAAWSHSRDRIGAIVTSFNVVNVHRVDVGLEVSRDSGAAVTCTVTAIADDHGDVGRQDVTLPAGAAGTQELHATVRTEREAVSVTVDHCR